jgi:transposase
MLEELSAILRFPKLAQGQNNKAKVVIRKSYGSKTSDVLKISLYHKLGELPVPEFAHEYF